MLISQNTQISGASQVALVGKNLPFNARRLNRLRFSPWVRKIPGERHGNPLKYSCLKNSMDIGVWQATLGSL